jgi:hypothetical protein
MAASSTSRKKPVARDTSVKPPTVKMRPIIGWPAAYRCKVKRIAHDYSREAAQGPHAAGIDAFTQPARVARRR